MLAAHVGGGIRVQDAGSKDQGPELSRRRQENRIDASSQALTRATRDYYVILRMMKPFSACPEQRRSAYPASPPVLSNVEGR
jgi:hypothetical protein